VLAASKGIDVLVERSKQCNDSLLLVHRGEWYSKVRSVLDADVGCGQAATVLKDLVVKQRTVEVVNEKVRRDSSGVGSK
jgi:hypothetical protein